MNLKILVTGSKGQLGNEIALLAHQYPEWEFIYTDVEELDITQETVVMGFLNAKQVDVLINCAAYTAVDKAEEDSRIAEKINVEAVAILARACKEQDVFMAHVSTDFIFGGDKSTPYTEEDQPVPLSVYARTKYFGEKAFLENIGKGIIVRTSWLYSTFGNNFVKTMMRLGKEKPELGVVYDQVGSPTYARDLAEVILQLIAVRNRITHPEIFNYSNEGVASWYDFAVAVMRMAGLKCHVKPIMTEEYPLPAKRPHYSLMSKVKIRNFLNLNIPHWEESLEVCVKKLNQNKN